MNWIELIKEYKEVIIVSFLFICSLIVNIVVGKKNKNNINFIDTIIKDVYEVLPSFINEVEVPGNGSTKLNTVLLLVQQYVFKKYGFRDFTQIEKQIVNHIEADLSTPHKKD